MSNNTNSKSVNTHKLSNVKRAGLATIASSLVFGVVSLTGMSSAFAAEAPIGLGTVGTYSVLGGQAVTNTGATVLGQDLGVSPGTAITGFPPGIVLGTTHAADAVALQAQSDLGIAYDDAAGRAPTVNVTGDLVGLTLPGGVYKSDGPLELSGALTLDGQGDPSSVFIFQVASTLTTASASDITLINGAQACNVYWQVGSSATLGTASDFKGTIMALTSVTVTTDATVEGRALARNGAVTLDNNVFTAPGCNTTVPTTPPATTPPAEPAPVVPAPTDGTAPTTPTTPVPTTPGEPAPTAPPVDTTVPGDTDNGTPPTAVVVPSAPGAGQPTDSTVPTAPNGTSTTPSDAASIGAASSVGDAGSGGGQLANTGVDSKYWAIGGVGLALLIAGLLMALPRTMFTRKH